MGKEKNPVIPISCHHFFPPVLKFMCHNSLWSGPVHDGFWCNKTTSLFKALVVFPSIMPDYKTIKSNSTLYYDDFETEETDSFKARPFAWWVQDCLLWVTVGLQGLWQMPSQMPQPEIFFTAVKKHRTETFCIQNVCPTLSNVPLP